MQDYDASGPPQRRQRAQVMGQRSVVLDLTEDAAILGPKSRARIEPIPKHAEPAVPDMTLADSSSTDTAFTERGTTPDLVRGGEEEKDETSSRRARGAKPNAAARAARAETKGPAKPPKRGPGSVTSLLNVMGESAPPGPCQHHSQRHSQRHSQHHCQHHDLTADTSGDDAAADRPQDLTGEDAEDGVAAAPASRKPRAKLRSKTGTRKRGRPAAAHVIDDDHEQGEDEDGDEDYSSKRAASAKLAKWAKKAGKSRRRSNSAKAGASSPVKVIHMLDDAYTPPRATRAMLRAMSEFGPLVELSVVLEEQEDKLGARVVPEPGHGGGFLVKTVATAGLAERAGVQPGDRLKVREWPPPRTDGGRRAADARRHPRARHLRVGLHACWLAGKRASLLGVCTDVAWLGGAAARRSLRRFWPRCRDPWRWSLRGAASGACVGGAAGPRGCQLTASRVRPDGPPRARTRCGRWAAAARPAAPHR
jgi:hypothetical protein